MKKKINVYCIKVIGTHPATGDPYWLGSDGNVWFGNGKKAVNEGSEASFLAQVKAGKWRFTPK